VLGAFAIMAFDPAVGLVALATVVVVLAVGVVSFARTAGTDVTVAVERPGYRPFRSRVPISSGRPASRTAATTDSTS
jgi:hypothetical protein